MLTLDHHSSVVNHTLQVTFPIASKKSNTLSLLVQVKFHVGKCIVINYCMLQVSQNLTIWFMVCAYNYHSKCSITLDNSYVLTQLTTKLYKVQEKTDEVKCIIINEFAVG